MICAKTAYDITKKAMAEEKERAIEAAKKWLNGEFTTSIQFAANAQRMKTQITVPKECDWEYTREAIRSAGFHIQPMGAGNLEISWNYEGEA